MRDKKVEKMKKYAKYVTRAKELRVKDAKIIPTKSIVTAEWVRIKCQFGCSGYGHGLMCPPYTPTPEQTRRILTCYNYALLVHVDEMINVSKIVFKIEEELFFDGYYKAFSMGAGPCFLCEKCPKFCRHLTEARPSMEACGIDVYKTVRAHGFPIEVLKTKNCKFNFYGLILIE
jgi:predicted metal-binding protein